MHPETIRPSSREPDVTADSTGAPPPEWAGGGYVPGYGAPAPGGLRYAGVAIGILLLLGLVFVHVAVLVPPPTSSGYPYYPSGYDNYRLLIRILEGVSFIAIDVTVAIAVMASWHATVARPDLTEATRRSLMGFASVLLGTWIVVSFVFAWLFLVV